MRGVRIFYAYMLEGRILLVERWFKFLTLKHPASMSVERNIRFDLIARLCPNTTGAELRSVATEVCSSLSSVIGHLMSLSVSSSGRHVCDPCTEKGGHRTRLFGCCGEGYPSRYQILEHVSTQRLCGCSVFNSVFFPASRPMYQVYN